MKKSYSVVSALSLVLLAFIFLWPLGGLGNNGHCDAWYYWGMSRSPILSNNTLELDYYPGSRVTMYFIGWFIPKFLGPIIWSKIYWFTILILGIACLKILLGKTESSETNKAIYIFIFFQLLPIVLSESMANYTQISSVLISLLIIASFFSNLNPPKSLFYGFLIGLLILGNAENLVWIPGIITFIIVTQKITTRKFVAFICGSALSYFFLAFILSLHKATSSHVFDFPITQIETLRKAAGNAEFFGEFSTPWFAATGLFAIHLFSISTIFILNRKRIITSSKLIIPASVQLVVLLILNMTGSSATFYSGFHAVEGYWVALLPLFAIYISKKVNNFSIKWIALLVFLNIAIQVSFIYLNKFDKNTVLFAVNFFFAFAIIIFTQLWFVLKEEVRVDGLIPILISIIALLSIHFYDYSYSFYQSQNLPLTTQTDNFEYFIADKSITFNENFIQKSTTAVTGLEVSPDSDNIKFVRSATRVFSSCGFPWSTFTDVKDFVNQDKSRWPRQLLLVFSGSSGMNISEADLIPYSLLKKIKYVKHGITINWWQLVKSS